MSALTTNIVASFASRAWSALLLLALVPFYIRYLGVEAYGVVGAFVALQALMSLLDLGFGPTLTRELARLAGREHAEREMRDLVRTLEIIYWAIAVVIFLMIWLGAPLIADHWLRPDKLSSGDIHQAITAAGLAFALQWPANLYGAGLTGLHRQVSLAWVIGGAGTLRPVITVLALQLIAPTLQVFFYAQACANLIQTLSASILLWRSLPAASAHPTFRSALMRDVLHFAAGMTGISVTTVALTQLDKAILSRTLPLETFGYYAVASTLAAGLYVLITPVFSVLFPKFAQLVAHEDRAGLVRLYDMSCQLMSVIILPVTAVAVCFSPEILSLWTHDPRIVAHSHLLLSLLIMGNALNGLLNVPYAVQLAHGRTSVALRVNTVAMMACVPLTYFLSIRLGAVGGAIVWLLLTAGSLIAHVPITHRLLLRGEQRRGYLVGVGGPAIVAFAVCALGRMAVPESPPGTVFRGLTTALSLAALLAAAAVGALLAAPDVRSQLLRRLNAAGYVI